MNKSIYRAGLVGSGYAASFHFEALKRVYGTKVEILGAYSKTPENLKKFTKQHNILAFDNFDVLLDACDVIHLCTPPATHEWMALKALKANKDVVIEKPLTGYFGDGSQHFNGDNFSREEGLQKCISSLKNILQAEQKSKGSVFYAENWVYAPAIQKEKEVIEKTGAQILWMQAQQSHSGSHSMAYGKWHLSGGGSLMGKGVHPITGAIYLKHVEGKTTTGKPIRPKSVSARVHAITRLPNYKNQGHLRNTYTDVEDYASVHMVFEDNTIADITASELLHGGAKNYLEVHANNHRTICNITPNNAMQTYNPTEENFKDIYVVEKTGTKQGWSNMSPDEAWFNGYQHEMEAFYKNISTKTQAESNSILAADVIATVYAAYLSAERKGCEVEVPVLD